MFLALFPELVSYSVIGQWIIIILIGGFMPLTAITYLTVMIARKEKEYHKALNEMGISSPRSIRDVHSPSKYILPVGFVTLLCLLAITAFVFANEYSGDLVDSLLLTGAFYGAGKTGLIFQSLSVLSMAFLGGFLWSAQNIIRRLIAQDISPSVYYSAGIRIILASVVALVFSYIIGNEGAGSALNFRSSLAAIAFLTGMFPERILTYLIKLFQRYVNPDNLNTDQLSLYHIEGISMPHKERLEEVGIDNAQNLATASLTELLIETPFGARQLIDWIGQAKLVCYAKDQVDAFRSIGIRSVFDLYKGNKSREALQEISEAAGINSPLLQVIADQVRDDRGIQALFKFQYGVNSPEKDKATVEPPVVVAN